MLFRLYLFEIDIKLFYHYSYKTKTADGKDTTQTVNTFVNYPASKDVRQINRIVRSGLAEKFNKHDSVNYLISTSGAYPKITMPLGRIRERIESKMPGKAIRNIFINSAEIVFEPTEVDFSKKAIPSRGLSISDDKIAVPRDVFARLLAHAVQAPEDLLTLPWASCSCRSRWRSSASGTRRRHR